MASVIQTVPPGHSPGEIIYPESDGKPMADNTLQWECIAKIKHGLDSLFEDRPDVFVAGDLLWYPVEGNPKICAAPDVMAAFGRPKGMRGSYRQWEESGIAPQVVFEVLSPSNTVMEMSRKFGFYLRHSVLEYYLYDPGDIQADPRISALSGWHRADASQPFVEIAEMDGWKSPQLGVMFQFNPLDGLRLIRPDGEAFETYLEVRQRAEQERQRAEQADQRAERLAAKLRAAGIDPEA